MNWMDKLERKWGRHAVANLSRYFVLAQVIGYVVQLTAPGLMSYMNFDMGSILHGQLWRVVTWIFTPTASLDVFGILFLGQFAGIHAWNIPHECIFVGKCDFVRHCGRDRICCYADSAGIWFFSVSVHVLYSDVHAAGAGHVHAGGRGTPVFCPSDQDEMDVNF